MKSSLPYFSEIVDDNSNEDCWTPLMWATFKSNMEISKKLI